MADPKGEKAATTAPDVEDDQSAKGRATDARAALCDEAFKCPAAPNGQNTDSLEGRLLTPTRLSGSLAPGDAHEVLRVERLMHDVLKTFDAQGVKTDARFTHWADGRGLTNAFNNGLMQTVARLPEGQLNRYLSEVTKANGGQPLDPKILAEIPALSPSMFASLKEPGSMPRHSLKEEAAKMQSEGEDARKIVMALASPQASSTDLTAAAMIANDRKWPSAANFAFSRIPESERPAAKEALWAHDTAKHVVEAAEHRGLTGANWDAVGVMMDGITDRQRAMVDEEAKRLTKGRSLEHVFERSSWWRGDQSENGRQFLRGDGGRSPYSVVRNALDTIQAREGLDNLRTDWNDSTRERATRTLLSTLGVLDNAQLAQLKAPTAGVTREATNAKPVEDLLNQDRVPQATRDAARVLMENGRDAAGNHTIQQIQGLLKIGADSKRTDIVEVALRFASPEQRTTLSTEKGTDGKTERDRILSAFSADKKAQASIADHFDYGEPSLLRLVAKDTSFFKPMSYETGVESLIKHSGDLWRKKYNDPNDAFRTDMDRVLDRGFSKEVAARLKAEMRDQEPVTEKLLLQKTQSPVTLGENDMRRHIEASWDEKAYSYFKNNRPAAMDQLRKDLGTAYTPNEVEAAVRSATKMSDATTFDASRTAARPEWSQMLKQVKGADDLLSTLDEMPADVRAKLAVPAGDARFQEETKLAVNHVLATEQHLLDQRRSGNPDAIRPGDSSDFARDQTILDSARVYQREVFKALANGSDPHNNPTAMLARYSFGALRGDAIAATPAPAVVKGIEAVLADPALRSRVDGSKPMSPEDQQLWRVIEASMASALANSGAGYGRYDMQGKMRLHPDPAYEPVHGLMQTGKLDPMALLQLGRSDTERLDIINKYWSPEMRAKLLSDGAGLDNNSARELNKFQESILGQGEHRRVFEAVLKSGDMTPVDRAYLDSLYADKSELAQWRQGQPDLATSLALLKAMPPEMRSLALQEAVAKGYTGLPAKLSEITAADQRLDLFDAMAMRPRSDSEKLFKANEQFDSRSASDLYSWLVSKVHSSVEARQSANDETFQALLKKQAQEIASSGDPDAIARYKQAFDAAIAKYSDAQKVQDRSVGLVEAPVSTANFLLWAAATYYTGGAVAGAGFLQKMSPGWRGATAFMAVKVPSTSYYATHMANLYAAYGAGGVGLSDYVRVFGYKFLQIKLGYLGAGTALMH